ncbi:MAG: hypothetical protein WA110_00155, partial [Anaerolineaceae bacterium]
GAGDPALFAAAGHAAGTATQTPQASQYPLKSTTGEANPTMDWTSWTPAPEEIVAGDSGKSFEFWLTSRFSLVLKEVEYPAVNLEVVCEPADILGRISNVESAPPEYYVIRYEGSGLGQCTVRNGIFEVKINIIDHP